MRQSRRWPQCSCGRSGLIVGGWLTLASHAGGGPPPTSESLPPSTRPIAVGERLTFADGVIPLALSGGLLTGNTTFRGMVLRRIRRRLPLGQVAVASDPALSAALAAARLTAGAGAGVEPA
jgi:hypothetical protein